MQLCLCSGSLISITNFQAITNYQFSGAILEDSELLNLVLYNAYSVDKLDAQGLNIFDMINASNHMPKISFNEFMLGLAENFGFYYSFGLREDECKMIYKKDLLKAAIVDFTDKALLGERKRFEAPENVDLSYEEDNNHIKGYEDFYKCGQGWKF